MENVVTAAVFAALEAQRASAQQAGGAGMMFERIAPEQHDTLDGVPEPSETPRLVGHDAGGRACSPPPIAPGKLPHALIFAGPRGIGKATLAFHLAHHLLKHPACRAARRTLLPFRDPASSLFRQIATGAHPSVLHLTRPLNDKTKSFKTVVTVDEIRRVNRFLSLTSHDGSYRVVIVDPADDMNTNAANALLKNLEEPPSRTLFILIAHSPGSLLPTIRSRCQMVRLAPLGADDLMAALGGGRAAAAGRSGGARGMLAERAGGSAAQRDPADPVWRAGNRRGARRACAAARSSDVAGAHRLADAVAGRDQAIQFDIFNRHALDLLAAARPARRRWRGDLGAGEHAVRSLAGGAHRDI